MNKTVKELADELGVSQQTIQYHYQIQQILDRFLLLFPSVVG